MTTNPIYGRTVKLLQPFRTGEGHERTNERTPKREMRDFEIKLPLLAVTRKARSAPIAMIKPPPPSAGAWKNEIREDVSYCLITPGPVKAGFWTEEGHEQISGGHVQTKQRGASDSGAA